MKYFNWINKDVIHSFSLLSQLGFIMIVNILIPIFFYKKVIEKYFFKNTLVFIALLIIGVFSGFYSAYKLIMKK